MHDHMLATHVPRQTRQRLGQRIRLHPYHRSPGAAVAVSDRLLLREHALVDAPCPLGGMPASALREGVYVREADGSWVYCCFDVEALPRPTWEGWLEERGINELPRLLQGWFGKDAGHPAAPNHYVRFTRWNDRTWHAVPESEPYSGPCKRVGDTFVLQVKVNHASGRPILLPLDRKKCPETPMGDTNIEVYGETWTFGFRKVAVNTAWPMQ